MVSRFNTMAYSEINIRKWSYCYHKLFDLAHNSHDNKVMIQSSQVRKYPDGQQNQAALTVGEHIKRNQITLQVHLLTNANALGVRLNPGRDNLINLDIKI